MVSRTIRLTGTLLGLKLLAACGAPDTSLTTEGESEPAERAATIYAALSEQPAAADTEAFRLAISSTETLDASTVLLCLATEAKCKAGEGTRIATQLLESNGRRIHVSAEPLRISSDLFVTVLGRSTAGTDVSRQFRFQSTSEEAKACYKAPDDLVCEVEGHIARLTNEFRQRSGGRRELTLDRKVSYVSRLWSAEQARRGSIGHDWFSNGRWRSEYVKEFNEQPKMSGENVAMTGGAGGNAEAVAKVFVDMWINSAGHRANMLGGHATIGVGVARRGSSWYATQNFGN